MYIPVLYDNNDAHIPIVNSHIISEGSGAIVRIVSLGMRIAITTQVRILSRSFANTKGKRIMTTYSMADQQARFAKAKKENNERYLNIDSVYDPSFLKGKRVAVTGANRGLGLELAKAVVAAGSELVGIVRSTSDELKALNPKDLVTGVDVTDNNCGAKVVEGIKGGPIDIVCL